ncbi:hypothetical protein Tco_1119494 [Tanacetum coccineum]
MEMTNPPEIFDAKVSLRLKMHLLFKNKEVWAKLDDYDAVRVCLLVVEEIVFMAREDAPFIQAIKPGQNVDEAPIVNEQSVKIDEQAGVVDDHDPTAPTDSNNLLEDVDSLFKEVIDVRPDIVGRVDELRTKLVQTITSYPSRATPCDDSLKQNESNGEPRKCYYQESQQGSLQNLVKALESELEHDVSCLQADNLDEARFDDAVKDNDEMEHAMDVDNEDGKYCLDDMSIGFEEDKSNGEIKEKKVNLDQCILDLMDMSEEHIYNTPSLKTGFGVVERKRKPGPALQLPYEQQKPTTPPHVKRRTITSQLLESIEFPDESQFDVEDEENLESTEYDCETMPPFTENIKSGEPTKLFKLAWDPYSIVVDDQFLLAFLGLEEKKELWVELLWRFRASDADWALVGPHFCPAIIGDGMPVYISKAKGRRVPWTDVDKSPLFLDKIEVLKRKRLQLGEYKITFQFEEKVPHQGSVYGDYGLWVCLLLYRLTHKLPLVFGDPLRVALAYREHMLAYYWKYKAIQQAAREEALVPKADRVKISSTNIRIDPTMTPKEGTYQFILDIIKNTSFYKAFLASADVPEIYMQQFWHTVSKVKESTF